MKKLLYQLDTDPLPASFDNVVAYDGGADQVTAYGGVDPRNVGALVDGTIFTRAPKITSFTPTCWTFNAVTRLPPNGKVAG